MTKLLLLGLLPGGSAIAALGFLYERLKTGDDNFDALRLPIILGVLSPGAGGNPGWLTEPTQALQAMRALMVIAQQENSIGQIGDTSASVGPSVSPWQISRGDAESMGFWTPPDGSSAGDQADRDAYQAQTTSIYTWARWAATDLRNKYDAASSWNDAIRRWNGSGSAATEYAEEAAQKANALGWQGLA